MKLTKVLSCLLLCFSSYAASACINYYVTDSSGHTHLYENFGPSHIRQPTKAHEFDWEALEKRLANAAPGTRHQYISNYCADLIKAGRFKAAIPILEGLLASHPGEYNINANLAVAYELNGEPEKALVYLKKSLLIKPDSHHKSEWIHQRILEAAILMKEKNLNPRQLNILKIKNDTQLETGWQLTYQLTERMPLSKSPNELLSKLIEESGDFFNAHVSMEWAIDLYAMAIAYTANSDTKTLLWKKIETARAKLVKFSKRGKKMPEAKQLLKPEWKKKVNTMISKWENYQPPVYDKEIKTKF